MKKLARPSQLAVPTMWRTSWNSCKTTFSVPFLAFPPTEPERIAKD